ncbi:hypothetical protein [Sphingomonas sp. KC8]|uniref:hypothetical protein n=1 Tax=Sphingomonas sp. KC8 TaxID=1030157 RepID=UPI000248A41A|nr:hypothetical protein [Sphingomonas sp. KC8]ARS27643.1 hypothetical protein KC8_10095 [Sphingomonas sp. KC8]
MSRPLDFTFPLTTPPRDRGPDKDPLRLSVRPLHTIGIDEMLAELRRTCEYRHQLYPRSVETGRMTRDEMLHHIALIEQILDDMTPAVPDLPWPEQLRFDQEKQDRRKRSGFLWPDKVRELRREIALRRNAWPKAIADGRRNVIEARTAMERLEAVHWRYWIACDHFEPADTHDAIRAHVAGINAFMANAIHQKLAGVTGHLTPEQRAWLEANIPPRKEAA